MESWAPQEGDHTSIASYGSVDKLKTGILSSSIAGVLLGQQEGIILLVSPGDQRSELVAEGPWSLTMVGMSDGLQRHLCSTVAFSLCSCRGCGQSCVFPSGLSVRVKYFSALHHFIAKTILPKTSSPGSDFMRKQPKTSIQTRQNSRAVVQD